MKSKLPKKVIRLIPGILFILLVVLALKFYILPAKQNQLEIITFNVLDLKDTQTQIFFSEENRLYKADFNGKKPQKIATAPRIITSIYILKNGSLLVSGEHGKYFGDDGKLKENWSYETEGNKVYEYYWLLNNGSTTLQSLDERQYLLYAKFADTRNPIFTTKQYPSGEADIILATPDTPEPKVTGHLYNKIDSHIACDSGSEKTYPQSFNPSFDQKYLLSNSFGGGGTCDYLRSLITANGSKIYDIKFNVQDDVIWIDNNKLLRKKGPEIITLNENGSFTKTPLDQNLNNYSFKQSDLSPSKKHLFLLTRGGDSILGKTQKPVCVIYDIEKNTITPLENPANVSFVKWNNQSTGFVYTTSTGYSQGDFQKWAFYDLQTNKSYVFATIPYRQQERYPALMIN